MAVKIVNTEKADKEVKNPYTTCFVSCLVFSCEDSLYFALNSITFRKMPLLISLD